MKLEADINEVVLSNVGTTGEFKIRNSAKAFKILSDGLYSNKIKAVIRELSCNAVDSHQGAGKADVPFEVHLPSIYEPWFSVRDFGLGLNDDQVVNIYTTYFESTKTDSNDFIGALGLGSKSPFSYTENFTVTAIKDGWTRIYSAFINEAGVPSIAKMSEAETTDVNGVEVKFSVTDRSDYNTFANEARGVFKWFKNKPTITGSDHFIHDAPTYTEENIIPGVHSVQADYYNRNSVAVMGNIAYPLNDIPAVEKHLGALGNLLECSLVIEFEIGELDFAASREQLSYIPSTLAAIKRRLEALTANLSVHLTAKVDAIEGEWAKAEFLYKEYQQPLFKSSVLKYVVDNKFELFDRDSYRGQKTFKYDVSDLASKDLSIVAFRHSYGTNSKVSPASTWQSAGSYVKYWEISVSPDVVIVLNDLKTGCATRARYHFKGHSSGTTVYCLSHSSTDQAVRQEAYDEFIKELHNPPTVIKASTLDKPERTPPLSSSGIMILSNKSGRYGDSGYTWEPYKLPLDADETYHYVCLSNYEPQRHDGTAIDVMRIKKMMDDCGTPGISDIRILGVRKSRLKEIDELDNWIWFEEILKTETAKVADTHIAALVVADILDAYNEKVYTSKTVAALVGPDSDYAKYVSKYGGIKRAGGSATSLATLCGDYGKAIEVEKVREAITATKLAIFTKYPLLKLLKGGFRDDILTQRELVDYIKMVDKNSI